MAESQIYIPIVYSGLDADSHEIDLVALGQSLQGAGRIIRSAANIVIPTQKASRLRVLAAEPKAGSFEIPAILMTLQPFLPILMDGAQKAVEGLVNYLLSKTIGKDEKTDRALEVAQSALREMGMTSRAAIEAIAKMSEAPRQAARQFLSPVGDSCKTARIGSRLSTSFEYDVSDREAIDSQPIEIGPQSRFEILISELDVVNKTCKFSVRDEKDGKRFYGSITDPSISLANNQYASALAQNAWLIVDAKAEYIDNQMTRLYISDSRGSS